MFHLGSVAVILFPVQSNIVVVILFPVQSNIVAVILFPVPVSLYIDGKQWQIS
jgi:hypothetical protein